MLAGRARLSDSQAAHVLRRLWEHTDDELLGLGRERLPRGSFRLLCYGLIGTPDLGSALRRAASLVGALPALSIRVEVDRRRDRVAVEVPHRPPPADDPDHVVVLSALLVVHRLIAWAVGSVPAGTSVELPYVGRAGDPAADALFGRAPVLYGARRGAVVLHGAALARPIVRTESDLERLVAGAPRTLLHPVVADDSMSSRVRQILECAARGGDWPLADQVAVRLMVSGQTLRRRLHEEGTSFRMIAERVRRDAALASLDGGHETIADLARRLGYSEASAFNRAFQRWTGCTPGTLRQRPDRLLRCPTGA